MQLVEATPLLTYEGFLAPWICLFISVMCNYATKAETEKAKTQQDQSPLPFPAHQSHFFLAVASRNLQIRKKKKHNNVNPYIWKSHYLKTRRLRSNASSYFIAWEMLKQRISRVEWTKQTKDALTGVEKRHKGKGSDEKNDKLCSLYSLLKPLRAKPSVYFWMKSLQGMGSQESPTAAPTLLLRAMLITLPLVISIIHARITLFS